MSESPSISVLIATLERPQFVCATIRSLLAQSYRPEQLIIVEQGEASQEILTTLIETWGSAGILIRDAGLGASRARSVGIGRARGDIVLCIDDDVIIDDPQFIALHARSYKNPKVGAVCGRAVELEAKPAGRQSKVPPKVLMPLCLVYGSADCRTRSYCNCLKGANMSIRHDALLKVGGFDLGLGATFVHEDTDLALRLVEAGYKILFEPDACLIHIAAKRGGGRHHVTTATPARNLAFRDRVLLFKKHAPMWTLPIFLTLNTIMAIRPLFQGNARSCIDALRGLCSGFRTYAHLTRWHYNDVSRTIR